MSNQINLDQPYMGKESLVIAIDADEYLKPWASASAVCIAHLQPGITPRLKYVMEWPNSSNESKVPSCIYYDKTGMARACCAETRDEFIEVKAQDEGWVKVEEFKLLLNPPSMSSSTLAGTASPTAQTVAVPALPFGLTLTKVYADLFTYLVDNAQTWFQGVTFEGEDIWRRLYPTATIILAHPDGWTERQQEVLRDALLRAQILTPDTNAGRRLEFVRESEASVHWTMQVNSTPFEVGTAFTLVDAGGSTVDVALYQVESVTPRLTLREVKTSDSLPAGGIFVTRAGKDLLASKLEGSRFDSADHLGDATTKFEQETKRRFVGDELAGVNIKVSSADQSDKNVQKGRVKLTLADLKSCFEPCLTQIKASVKRQSQLGDIKAKHLVLVGGFGESPYLKNVLRDSFSAAGIKVVTSDEPSKKAVAEGAVIWYVQRFVVARSARSTFGIALVYPYNTQDEEHLCRGHITLPDRFKGVRGGWSTVIAKDTVVDVEHLTTMAYTRLITEPTHLKLFEIELYAYDGPSSKPAWCLDAYGNLLPGFRKVCDIAADLSPLEKILVPRLGAGGVTYWEVSFALGISFGSTTLSAKVLWNEKGIKREGPASIVLGAIRGAEA